MLIGMALFKLGVFSATRSVKFYIRFLGVAGLIGFPLVAHSAAQLISHNWDPNFSLLQHGGVYNYVGSIGVALFLCGLHYADFENVDLACDAGPSGCRGAHGIYKLYPAICDRDGIVLWLCIWIVWIGCTLGAIFDCADYLGISALDIIHLAF